MKTFFLSIIVAAINLAAISETFAQGYELKFNRALIIDNNQQTVPVGTVWKITSIYGEEREFCIPADCYSVNYYTKAVVSALYVNNVLITSSIRGLKAASNTRYSVSDCSAGAYSSSGYNECPQKTTDPNILPFWLPAGANLRSAGPNTFVSVIEFIIQ